MFIKEKEANGVPVLTLTGKLDIFAKNSFREALDKHKSQGKKVLLDFKGVSFMDSVGLGILATSAKAFQDVKGTLILVNPQKGIIDLLSRMNLTQLLPMLSANDDFSSFARISITE